MKTLGQIAFEAYKEAKDNVTYDSKPIPTWSELGVDVQSAWEKAAYAVRKEIGDPRRSLRKDPRETKPL